MKYAPSLDRLHSEAAFEVLAKAKALERKGKRVLHFEIGEPDFNTPEIVKDEAKKSLDENFTHYVPSQGIIELREAVCEYIEKTRNFKPTPEQVLIVPGVKPGIFYSMLSLIDEGDEVIYPDPGFPTYSSLVDYTSAGDVPLKLLEKNEFRMSPDDINEKITKKTKMIILNSPHNPTGSMLKKDEIKAIYGIAEDNDVYLLSDEVYSQMTYEQTHYSVTEYDNASERSILIDGFSKSFAMTGWRLGYAIGPEELIKKMTVFLINSVSCTNAFIQKAGITALKDFDSVKKMVDKFRDRRNVIVKGLNEVNGFRCIMPMGAFYAFPNITETGKTSNELADYLLEKSGIAVLPGTAFGPGGEGYLRFSYASSIENIKEAIEKMKDVL
ncbi:MAG: pyridoxal phosphate-dependent aminotransferase [Candidatus Thermoplasmatota archaeon]|nr:pyridoxal phosphate-dependent aminotransferase [Candidatus Thermoplasmatota archaeon]